ncbi:MAG TPA: hypothetical protein VKY15_04805, partial [Acidimicrobiales bacterium]|nr:hypothetical protein [Acidimicrobiales bacterium]
MALRVLDRTGLGGAGGLGSRSRVLGRRPRPVVQVLEHLDVLLVVSTVVLAGLGVLMVYSATRTKLAVAGV